MLSADKPIQQKEEDQLGRRGFAELLAQALINLSGTDTYSVGLYGKWGSGKTSLVNMLVEELNERQKDVDEEHRFVLVHFEPWNFSGTDQLLSQFLSV